VLFLPRYVLLVNLVNNISGTVGVRFVELGIPAAYTCDVYDLWVTTSEKTGSAAAIAAAAAVAAAPRRLPATVSATAAPAGSTQRANGTLMATLRPHASFLAKLVNCHA